MFSLLLLILSVINIPNSIANIHLIRKDINIKYDLSTETVPIINTNVEYQLVDKNAVKTIITGGAKAEYLTSYIEAQPINEVFTKSPSWKKSSNVTISDEERYSGDKSICFSYLGLDNQDENYEAGWLVYTFPKRIKEMYFSTWVKLVKRDAAIQFLWKINRLNNNNQYDMALVPFNSVISFNPIYNQLLNNGQGGWGSSPIQIYINGILNGIKNVVSDAFIFDEWQRIEQYYKRTMTVSGQERLGVVDIRRVGRSGGEEIAQYTDVTTHTEMNMERPLSYWRYFLIGMYYGNLYAADGSKYQGDRNMRIYYDDIYLSDTRARLELGNSDTWVNCTKREIQKVVSWPRLGNDRTITFKFYKGGSFTTGDAWLYYVNHDGNPTLLGKVNLQ